MSDPRLYASINRIESEALDQQGLERFDQEEKEDGGITIFIPNWNHRAFLPRSLRSALDALRYLEKEGFEAEILTIDDASRDGSQKLLRTVQALYNEPRLKTICLQRNLGLTRLRNLALRACRFRHMCLLDADNELVPANLPLLLRAAHETGAALVHGNLIDKQDGEVVGARSNMVASMSITRKNYIDGFSIVDVEKALKLGSYSRSSPYNPDDWEMILHLIFEEENIVFVPVVLGYYYKQALSGSHENVPFHKDANSSLHRVFAQSGLRDWDSERVGRMYHPDAGYVDEW